MEIEALKQEINTQIAMLGNETNIARPTVERTVLNQIRLLLETTREQRTASAREIWEYYLPYAAKLCGQLTKLEEGWEDDLEYFASENAQFWLDNASSFLEKGNIPGVGNAVSQIIEATRLAKRDMIAREEILLRALDIALELSDKKRAIQIYEEADKIYRKHLSTGDQYTGSIWLRKIQKFGRQLAQYQEKLQRYFHYAETVTVSIQADSQGDLERVIEYLQQSLSGKVKITRRAKEAEDPAKPGSFRARVKITLE